MGNLSNLYVSRSFQSLIHLATDNTASANLIGLEDGYGNPIGVSVNTAGDLSISGSLTASLQSGYVWVGNGSGKTTTVATSSFGTNVNTASLLVTASAAGPNITFTKGDASQFTITIATGSFVSASYAETASIARNVVIIARNGNASTLPIGTVVHITSAVGDNPIFNTASYDNESLSSNTLGVLRQAAATGTDVEVVVQGTVVSVNTDPALGFAAGDVIYLSSSGQFTNVQPQAPNQIVTLGQVLRAQQNNGSIYVSINNGWELNELHNVQITNPQTGDLIQYESASYGLWKNKSVINAGITPTSSFNAYTSSQALLNGTFATTGSNIFIGNQIINGTVSISSSAAYDLDVTGAIRISGAGTPQLLITGSTSGLSTTITATQLAIVSASVSSGVTSKVIASSDTTGTPTTSKYLGFSANPSQTGIPSLSTISDPSIIAASGSTAGAFYAPITFQRIGTWTDGRVTFNNPIVGLRSLELTGSFTASLTQGYTWVGNGNNISTLVATSSFGGGAGFPYTGSAQITGSLGITGSLSGLPITLSVVANTASIDMNAGNQFVLTLPSSSTTHIAPSSIKAGQTINLLIKQQVGPGTGSITFAPSILFPSGLDMQATSTGSAIDLISMISFDTTNLMAANVKNLK